MTNGLVLLLGGRVVEGIGWSYYCSVYGVLAWVLLDIWGVEY